MIEIIDDKKREKLFDNNGEPYYCFHIVTKEGSQTKDNYQFFSGRRAVQYGLAWVYNEKEKIERANKREKSESITSNQISNLLEKYLINKLVHTFNGDRELVIYQNPDTSERQDIILSARQSQKGGSGPFIRIIADAKTQKVYVWDGYDAEHITGRSLVGLPTTDPAKTPWLLYGTCKPRGTKFELVEWDSKPSYKDIKFFDQFFSYNWNWLSSYVDTREFFDDTRRWVADYRKTSHF